MKVLITGSSGFTGKYLSSELVAEGLEVVPLKSNLLDKCSLLDEVRQSRPDYVVHLAAVAFVASKDIDTLYATNILGTRNLLESVALGCPNIQKILLASSANVYGNANSGRVSECQLVQPENDYSVSKQAMELMARLWKDDLPLIITRPFNYTGVGQEERYIIPKLISHFAQAKDQVELGNIDVFREFGDVRAISVVYKKLLLAGACFSSGEVVNVCTGKAISLKAVVGLLEEMTGRAMEVRINPAFVRSNEVKELYGDNSKLLKYFPELIFPEFEETLKWMLDAYRSNVVAQT